MKLSQKKYRDKSDILLIEGNHLIEEAYKRGLVQSRLSTEEDADIVISEAISEKLSLTKSGSNHFAIINKPVYTLVEGSRYLVLDKVQDPGNVGTMIRTAYSFGFDCVILSLDSADEWSDKTIRSSQGAVFHIPVVRMDLQEGYLTLKQQGVRLIATHVDAENEPLQSISKESKLAFVMGSEGEGVGDTTLSWADQTIHIETSQFDSLNVGVAAGVICYEFRK